MLLFVVVILRLFLLVVGTFLLFLVAEVPRQGEVHAAAATLVHLVAREGVATGKGFPSATVEQVAATDGEGELLVQEILAHAEVYRIVGFAVSLWDDLLAAVSAACLHGDVVRQHHARRHARAPREVVVGVARHGLSVDVITETVGLVIIGVGGGGEVEDAEQFVFEHHFQTRIQTLRHVHRGGIHQSVGAALIVDALHHVGGGGGNRHSA